MRPKIIAGICLIIAALPLNHLANYGFTIPATDDSCIISNDSTALRCQPLYMSFVTIATLIILIIGSVLIVIGLHEKNIETKLSR